MTSQEEGLKGLRRKNKGEDYKSCQILRDVIYKRPLNKNFIVRLVKNYLENYMAIQN